jgi:uncharacterized membrane protein YagU involved in acid resistance
MKTNFSFQSAIIAGIIATVTMTAFTFMAPLMGIEMNIPKMLAGTMGAPVIIGWLAHFMIGIILAVIYSAIFLPSVRKEANFKNGAVYGLFPWLLAQIMVMPMMIVLSGGSFASGLFSGSIIMAMASLAGHLLYGAVLGAIYNPKTVTVTAAVL